MRKSFAIPEEKSCIDPNIDNDNIDLLNLCLNLPSKNPAQESHAHGDCAETDFYPEAPNISEFSKPPQKSVKKTSHGPQTLKTSTSEDSVVFLYENKKYGNLQPPIIKEDDFLFPTRRKLRSFKSSFNLTSKSVDKFPFEETKSGHLKITKSQVAYSSKNLSVLVANPSTKVCIEDEEYSNMHETRPRSTFGSSQLDSIMSREGLSGLSKLMDKSPNRIRPSEIEVSEYDDKETCDILSPEIQLTNLGFNIDGTVKWGSIRLPEKKNLYLELYSRITNYTNADCKIVINSEQFNCHLIVLQCYSETFNVAPVAKQLEIPQDKCSPESFAFIYEWMICGEPAYKDLNRDNVLDIFKAAKYLKIKDLVEQCWSFIDNVNIFSEDTAYFLYVLAKERNLPEVCELMLPRIETFFLMLVSSRDWVVIDLADIKLFLSSNYICVNCEMEIFMAAVRWLKYDWTKRKGFTYEVLQCIRFGNIAPWQLVDIKRNPENPEFMELVSDPRICKMIEDGLSYVIIKYWYGHEREDFDRWNDILELNEPQARHWSGTDKTYFTYREFLIYLDKYRRSQTVITLTNTQLNILNHGTAQNSRDFTSLAGPSGLQSGSTRIPPRIPTLDEIIEKQAHTILVRMHNAARTIQNAYRRYRKRKWSNGNILYCKSNRNIRKCLEMFKAADKFRPEKRSDESSSPSICSSEGYKESILIFGGIDPDGHFGVGRNTSKNIFQYIAEKNAWEYMGELPEARHQHSVALLKGRIYLAGGTNPHDSNSEIIALSTVWSFDPTNKLWYKERQLNVARKLFGLVNCNRELYAIGGEGKNQKCLKSVEVFNSHENAWENRSPMLNPRSGAAFAQYDDNYILVAGGVSKIRDDVVLDTVEWYDVQTDQWTIICRLKSQLCGSSMCLVANKLYVVGGAVKLKKEETASIEVWDCRRNEWMPESIEIGIPRHGHCIACLGTQIFIMGGFTATYKKSLNSTECFCYARGMFIRGIASLPLPLTGHAAITLSAAS